MNRSGFLLMNPASLSSADSCSSGREASVLSLDGFTFLVSLRTNFLMLLEGWVSSGLASESRCFPELGDFMDGCAPSVVVASASGCFSIEANFKIVCIGEFDGGSKYLELRVYTWVLNSLVGSCDLLRVEKLKGMKYERIISGGGPRIYTRFHNCGDLNDTKKSLCATRVRVQWTILLSQ